MTHPINSHPHGLADLSSYSFASGSGPLRAAFKGCRCAHTISELRNDPVQDRYHRAQPGNRVRYSRIQRRMMRNISRFS